MEQLQLYHWCCRPGDLGKRNFWQTSTGEEEKHMLPLMQGNAEWIPWGNCSSHLFQVNGDMLFGIRFVQVLVTSCLYRLLQDCNYCTAEKSLSLFHLSNKNQREIEDKVLWKKIQAQKKPNNKTVLSWRCLITSVGKESRNGVFAACLRSQ